MNKRENLSLILAGLLIVLAALSRVIMYPNNFSPIIGMALFSGALFSNKRIAFLMPILAMFLSDVLFEIFNITAGFWGWGQLVGYGLLALITAFAFRLKKVNPINVVGFSVLSSLFFYLGSNLSFFLIDNPVYHTYPNTWNGLTQCYVAALPFLRTSLVADLVYSGLLFGAYLLLNRFIIQGRAIV